MFGLSLKEKLFNGMKRLCNEKLPIFEADMRDFLKVASSMDENKAKKEYLSLVGRYSDAISGELANGFGSTAALKAGLAFQSPKIAGLPDEINMDFLLDTGPLVGYYFAFYYYGITGNKIAQNDYAKYIRPLNQYQTDLINTVLNKLG